MRKLVAVIGGATLALATISPTLASADDAATPAGGDSAPSQVVKSDTGSYIVVMAADPLVVTIAAEALDSPAAVAEGSAIEASHADVLAAEGIDPASKVQDYTNALNGFSARLGYADAVKLAANPLVSKVLPDELRHLTADEQASSSTSSASGPSSAPTGGGTNPDDLTRYMGLTAKGEAYKSGLTGAGVVVGVIDTGIWPEHPSFADDGTFPAHAPLDAAVGNPCDFGNTAANANDAPFTCNNKLVGARQMMATYRRVVGADPDEFVSARDDDGHGTHTASTAAGDASVQATIGGRNVGVISGIAPRAQVIAYKALGNGGGFTSDLAAAIDQAVADGVDVINYSVGGGPTLISADAISFLFAAEAGVFIAVSAGNDGPGSESIGGPADTPWVTGVGASTMKRFFEGHVHLDHGPTLHGASITDGLKWSTIVDAETVGTSDLCLAGTLDPVKVKGKIVLCRRGGNGREAKGFEVYNAGGVGMILYNNDDVDNLFTDNHWVPAVHLDNVDGLQVKNYIATYKRPKAKIDATARVTTWKSAPSMTIFSSRGPNPTSADIIKPDVTAPGMQILAGNSPFPDPDVRQGELFQSIAGTSMSSPVTAGVYALIKQAHPDWSAAEAKSAIMTTANTKVKDNDRVSQAGPFAMGAGEVHPGIVKAPGSAFNPGLVYDAHLDDYLSFLCDAKPEVFAPDTEATCSGLAGAGFTLDASDLNYPSISVAELAGTQTVTRTVTSVASKKVSYKVKIEAPPGYSLSVSPDHFSLKPGEKKTYQVVITNTGATLGEWRTGALTWKGSDFAVRSPIAVRGVPLKVPVSVDGTGVAGTTSFDLQFGYTGAYTANAHGLVPAVQTPGIVSQDPDQAFPSPDDGAGVVSLPFTLTGAAFARWELKLPGIPDDLDVYLLDSAGNIVAQSTNGGTDEQIDLTLPPDGDYTLVVHGWAVPSAPLAFTVNSWVVPATPGGSLTIDSAPTAATNGATGTVAVSWAGLTAGTRYLGAVSHSDAAGIVDLTLVSVTA